MSNVIVQDIHSVRDDFSRICVDQSINFEAEAAFAIQSLMGSEYAMKIATGNRQSVINAVRNIAAIGISLNPAKRQAYLVPRKGAICLMISYMGLLDLAIQSGSILWGQAELVYANDAFALNGFDQPPTHSRNPFCKDRGDLIGVYAVVKTHSGDYLTATMTAKEVFDIRDRTDAWMAYKKDSSKKCPWVTDEGEMVKKTVIKRAYKTWPKSDRLDAAIHHLNTDAGEGIEFTLEDPLTHPKYLGLPSAQKAARIRKIAGAALALFNVDDLHGMWGEVCDIDNDEKQALWMALGVFSDCRSAIKRMGQEEASGNEKLTQQATPIAA